MAKVTRKPGPAAARFDTAMKSMDNLTGKVGWFETAKYADGTSVAYVASIHEFGVPEKNIPARPFMRPTVAEQTNAWRDLIARGAKAIMRGSETAESVLDKVGMRAAADIAKTIAAVQNPPLAEGTVDARRRQMADRSTTGNLTKPLVDTAIMINSVTNTVEKS